MRGKLKDLLKQAIEYNKCHFGGSMEGAATTHVGMLCQNVTTDVILAKAPARILKNLEQVTSSLVALAE